LPLLALGLNHKTAEVEVREALAFPASSLPLGLRRLKSIPGVEEACILSTCNRTEIYCLGAEPQGLVQPLVSFLADFNQAPQEDFLPCLYQYANEKAAQHLFEVACGLDSMVIGESEVLSQVREALQIGEEQGSVGPVLHSLFRHALSCGKRGRTETQIGRGGLSVAGVAVELAKSIFGDLRGHCALVLGAGETSELTLKHLLHGGISAAVVSNRTYQRAAELAERFQCSAVEFESFPTFLPKADIVIASTSATGFICDKPTVALAMRERKERPLLLIDIAVPRDIDPAVNELPNVFLYDIDDLQKVVQANRKDREGEVSKVKKIVGEAVAQFMLWLAGREALPLIRALRNKAEDIRLVEERRALSKLTGLSDTERKAVGDMSRRLVAKLLADPLSAIRQFAGCNDADYRLDIVRQLLGLEEDGAPVPQPEQPSAQEENQLTGSDTEGSGDNG